MGEGEFWPPVQGDAWANLGAERSSAERDPVSPSEDLGPAGRAEREAGPPEPERIAPEGPDPDRIAPDRPDPGRIAPEVSRRVNSILDAVEREAESIRERAKEDARRYIEYSRRRADGLVAERQRVIAALSDELVGRAERVLKRLDDV